MSDRFGRLGLPLIVGAATLLAFSPVLWNDFIDWDDGTNFVDNTAFRGFGWTNVRWMLTTFHLGVYQPVAWAAVALQWKVGGLNPSVYHAASWLFHAGTAVSVYAMAVLLFSRTHGASFLYVRTCAAVAALFFSLHPLRVEAVAWASAQGYPLAGLLGTLSVAAYLRAQSIDPITRDKRRAWVGWLLGSSVTALLAFLSKPIAVTLPAAFVLLDWHMGRRITRTVLLEKLLFILPAAAIAMAAPLARDRAGLLSGDHYSLLLRIDQAVYGLAFYLWKTIAPTNLTFYYPLPIDTNPLEVRFILSALAVISVAVLVAMATRRGLPILPAALAYVAFLSPVLGLIPQGGQLAADRYTYLASIPVSLMVGATTGYLANLGARKIVAAGVLTVLILLGTLTWRQTHAWRDSVTLWTHAVQAAPTAFQAHNNLGLALLRIGNYEDALGELDETLRLNPRSAKAYFNRGLTLAKLGRIDDALESYESGLHINPSDPTARAHRAQLLADTNRLAEAEKEYRTAISLAPHPDLFNSLGIVLAQQDRLADAIVSFREALAIAPDHIDARENLAAAMALTVPTR